MKKIVDATSNQNDEDDSGWFSLIGGIITIIITVELYKLLLGTN